MSNTYNYISHSHTLEGPRSSLDELKALRELKQLKELKEQLGNVRIILKQFIHGDRVIVFRMFRNYSCKLHATVAFFNRLKSYFFQGVVTAATRGPLESTTKIVPGAVTFQNTEAMTKVKFFNYQDLLFLHERLKYLF